jgi:hypothetical protein
MTTIAKLQGTIDAMSKEFGLPYELEQGGSGVSWKLTLRPMGSDILRAPTKAQLLRDMQNYREGMREGLRMATAMI